MIFTWNYQENEPKTIKKFVKEVGLSKGLLAKVKFQGGRIAVNGKEENVLYSLKKGDLLEVTIPDEEEHETLLQDNQPLEIIYEDEHFLVVNKPIQVASIPAQFHPNGTMANRVKHYIMEKNYPNKVVHIVTRLDRDTSGLMLFAKHGFAHALLDQQLRNKQVLKKYVALVGGNHDQLASHEMITLPIERDTTSILKRQIGEQGLSAQTEYWLKTSYPMCSLVDIRLHTGRTHQIRVHFEGIGCPLLGDELYHGNMDLGIKRQALHCEKLSFTHPFTKEMLTLTAPLPQDMIKVIDEQTELKRRNENE
ncbi:RluA family pseudouridine synthase [Vagococcus humatus]|uniref:Pseudouridine synthase n=1 Tax=Vagococcus humatus TaxID=1889241 RepID=A0A3R9YEF3_9ENTE|nr:RluA family pseudouridine synthase [Vagococcus humatus]RST90362.1 RluA family pseudouridine synthase [Vagococcus humatus]